jgi:hypothetical protein
MLLQTIMLSRDRKLDFAEKLRALVQFGVDALGKFSKTGIYPGWKLFGGAGKTPSFFAPAEAPSASTLNTLRGMAWDVTFLRITERLSGVRRSVAGRDADFFVPFIASYDRKFKALIQACPVAAIVTEPELGITNTVFRDELKFRLALDAAKADQQLGSFGDQFSRLKAELDSERLETAIAGLEQTLDQLCAVAA